LKNQQHKIQQFELSRWAKAGIAIKNIKDEARKDDHDTSKPHRDNHYLLMVATLGRFKINLDFQEITITAPALLFVFPGQVHHIIDIKEPEGWSISFDPSLMDSGIQLVMERGLKGPVALDQQKDFYHYAVTLMNLMERVQSERLGSHGIQVVHSLLDALLGLIAEKVTTQFASHGQSTISRAAIIEQSFNQLLRQHYKIWKQPARYASELHISVAYLYEILKGSTGISASILIQQHSILEAKRLLYFTDLSIKEIGYETGYDEPVYFGKLFKKITGLTPLQFRQQYRD
jgi:AraC family transcriptional regulator, transcriptional activator of pobA